MTRFKPHLVPFRARGAASCNVPRVERWLTGMAGLALAAYGVTAGKGRRAAGAMTLAGGGLLLRATTGFCPVYAALGRGSADADWAPDTATESRRALSGDRGMRVRTAITIDRPRADVYRFWRNLENLPRFMQHLQSVRSMGGARSHWVARGPAGTNLEWDAEIVHEEPDKLIGWQTLPGADVVSAGSVHFEPAPGGHGTEVRVKLQYQPPGGNLGVAVAKLFGEDPERQINDDLTRLKRLLEAGDPGMTGESRL